MNRWAYEKLIAEDLEWLMAQPRTLERDHIADVLRWSVDRIYPRKDKQDANPDPGSPAAERGPDP